MIDSSEIAIISAAVLAYLDSEGIDTSGLDETRLRVIIGAAITRYIETEHTVTV
ncbi:hypothetical protein Dform_01261 [Dehalogenimonas formicexedens]|uniref:Uncharacterized protein n=1 Tax=Dehalogenimonas formicexedens TaxID=1839801 RepID=A0A1P8F7Y6_9CHLR|nr:hypothetical protein [Dehalogenimonas formicexedens]APV44589.1 hypothetical protein Dform_01261 [Dehalogenimonas formicexedens]